MSSVARVMTTFSPAFRSAGFASLPLTDTFVSGESLKVRSCSSEPSVTLVASECFTGPIASGPVTRTSTASRPPLSSSARGMTTVAYIPFGTSASFASFSSTNTFASGASLAILSGTSPSGAREIVFSFTFTALILPKDFMPGFSPSGRASV